MSERPVCSVQGCENDVLCRELCRGHYSRLNRDGDVRADVPLRPYRHNKKPKTGRRYTGPVESPRVLTGGHWVTDVHGIQRWKADAP